MCKKMVEGDFTGHSDERMLKNTYDAITELELWDWLKYYTPIEDRGYMFSLSREIHRIQQHPKVISDLHSGASFAWCMRNMEVIAKDGWEHYSSNYIPHT